MNENKYALLNGDCLELLSDVPDHKVDLVLCDLPYGTTACKWDSIIPMEGLWKHYDRIVKPNGAILLFGAEPFSSFLRLSNLSLYKYDWIWHKTQATGHLNARKQPMREYETISVFYKKQCTYNPQMFDKDPKNIRPAPKRKNSDCYNSFNNNSPRTVAINKGYPRNVIRFANCNRGEAGHHPTQKPVALLEYLIKTYSNLGEIILDNTCGSGSTGVAAINTGRYFLGIEQDTQYFNAAQKRIEEAVNNE